VSVKPGFIDTKMSQDYKAGDGENISRKMAKELLDYIPANRPGTPDDIANAILWLASDNANYINGCELIIDGGLSQNFSSYTIKNLQFPEEY
jgi:NAD(P)-dependent dehydrogenase (short-subunit alcohol dehydrogenase family)